MLDLEVRLDVMLSGFRSELQSTLEWVYEMGRQDALSESEEITRSKIEKEVIDSVRNRLENALQPRSDLFSAGTDVALPGKKAANLKESIAFVLTRFSQDGLELAEIVELLPMVTSQQDVNEESVRVTLYRLRDEGVVYRTDDGRWHDRPS